MKIIVDPDKCVGCDMCKDISGGAMGIEYGKDGKAGQNPEIDMNDSTVISNAKLAAESCPMQAVTITE